MIDRKEAFARLAALGAHRWDTNPPREGRIRWFDRSYKEVASGRYAVILSAGPGPMYTMGFAVEAYRNLGIPVVPAMDDGPPIVADISDEAQIWARAEAIGAAIGADFVYPCSTLVVAVTGLREATSDDEDPAQRLRARLSAGASSWLDLLAAGNADAMDFAKDDVTPADIPALAELYFTFPRRDQRISLVLFAQDHQDPAMEPVWRDLLTRGPVGEAPLERSAFAVAVAGLEGDVRGAHALASNLAELLRRIAAHRDS
jgi:hypothetical protein